MSYRLYPVTPVAPACNDYTVKLNGTPVVTDTARVSAIPHNRRWPGHQRDISQSEPVQFLSLATDEPLSFEVIPAGEFDPAAVRILPRSLGITPKIEGGVISFTLPRAAYFTVEAYGRRRALHVFADPMPSYDVDKNAPGVRYFGAGEHDAGLIELHSGETLFLDEGAVVYACIYAKDARNIRILGRGILDNSRNKEEILFEASAEGNREAIKNATRRHTVQLEYCTDVEIDGITIRDSLVYNIRPLACRGLKIRNVKIIGCWRYNSDGIDMHNCEGVRIADCFIRTFDDSICIKGFDCYYEGDVEAAVRAAMYRNGESYDVFRDVLVERCTVWNDWGKCLEIGAETRAEEITDITFRDCDIIHVQGIALDCLNVDYADVHDVLFENIDVDMDEQILRDVIQKSDGEVYENPDPEFRPPVICVEVRYHHEYSAGGARRGKNRDITFQNITLRSRKRPLLRFGGYSAEYKTENILIRGLTCNGVPVRALEECECVMNEFAENIRVEG